MSRKLTRRDLLKHTAAAAAATMVLPGIANGSHQDSPLVGARANIGNAGSSTKNMHLSLAAYSVREALTAGEMNLFKFIDWCAELGLPGAELTSYYFDEDFDRGYLRELHRHAFLSGVTVSGTAIRNNFCLPPGDAKDREIAHVRQWIDHAADFFAPHIRIFAGDLPDGVAKETGIAWVAEGIRTVLNHAADRGIVLGLENHGGITARAADHLAICDAVGEHPWFGVNLDTGNYRTNPYEELAMAAPRAVNVQVKVEIAGPDGELVPTDLNRVRDMLVEANYRGWVVLEYESAEDPRIAIPRHLDEMRAAFGWR